MTVLWLLVWLVYHTPPVHFFSDTNNWGIALALCIGIDLISGGSYFRD